MIITLDGPAGSGKSSVARRVAERLGFDFLDTGAMYRAIGLAALRREIDLDDARALGYVAKISEVTFDFTASPPAILLDGESVGPSLRGSDVTRAASYVAVVPAIRARLVDQQRRIGGERANLVTEGRDQGSVVFPDAAAKFYVDADPSERARRRVNQLRARGESADYNAIFDALVARDRRDAARLIGPLAVPPDATILDTTRMGEEDVIEQIVAAVRQTLDAGKPRC